MKTTTLIAVALVFGLATSSFAEDIYISYSNINEGGGNSIMNTDAEFLMGSSGSAFVWVTNGFEIDTGAVLDVLNSNTSVVAFTGGTVFNPDILVGPPPTGTAFNRRWTNLAGDGGQAGDVAPGDVADGQLTRFQGFRVNAGTGIVATNTGPTFFDALFDGAEDAFLFGRFDFDVVGVGTADFSVQANGPGQIVHMGSELFPVFGGATVTGVAIPEPASATLIALGLIGLVSRRRR